jgi:hypothetical protein
MLARFEHAPPGGRAIMLQEWLGAPTARLRQRPQAGGAVD